MCVFLLASALMPSAANAERRVALVIGNSEYVHAKTLRNPRNDAIDMAETLKKLDFKVVLGLDLDQQNFARMIDQYARMLEDADVGLFYYAGHGLQINEKNYLVSTSARLENEFLVSSEAIELDSIVRLMESRVPVNLVFLDACRNNPLADKLRQQLAATKRSAMLGRGLARVEPTGRDTLVAFAAAPGQEAADGRDRNSPFTGALLKHLPKPGLEVSVMLKEVAADVRRDTGNVQRPQQLSDMSKTFYFGKAEMAAPAPRSEPAPRFEIKQAQRSAETEDRALEVAFWNAAQAANECEAVRAYLQRFPNGIFVELAKLSERRLCESNRRIDVIDASPPGQGPAVASSPTASPRPPAPAPAAPRPLAALPEPATNAPPQPSVSELAKTVQSELRRVGCFNSEPDGKWGRTSREALSRFNAAAPAQLELDEPSTVTAGEIRAYEGRVCELQCRKGTEAEGDRCVAIKREPSRKSRAEREERQDRQERRRETRQERQETRRPRRQVDYDEPVRRRRVAAPPVRYQAPAPRPAAPKFEPCFTDEGQGRMRPCDAGGGR
jgi:uncharacterized caspase-like protein